MLTHINATLAVDARDVIGEGPVWDARGQRLLWTDNAVGIVHVGHAVGAGGWRETSRWSLNRRLGDAVPRAKGGLVVASGLDILMLDETGGVTPFIRIDADPNHVEFNEIKCDSRGRLWAGTLSHEFIHGRGALYRIDPDGAVTKMLDHITVANGLDWSPDDSTFYYIDSITRSIDAFDFDAAQGSIRNRRSIVTIKGEGEGGPDGLCVDRDGNLWAAIFGAGEVRCYSPAGALLARVAVTAPAVTSCAFGGSDGGELFITTAGVPLPDMVMKAGVSAEVVKKSHTLPGAGGLFVCRPGATGNPAVPFAG